MSFVESYIQRVLFRSSLYNSKGEISSNVHTHTHITIHLHSYSLPPLTEAEKSSLEQTRADKSLFVQELLLSMLASSSSSSSDSGSDSEDGT